MADGKNKTRSRWRTALRWTGRGVLVLLLLAVIGGVGFELWRQHDIRNARAEQEAATAEVMARFSDVDAWADAEDWRAWWHGRIDGTWGGDEFHKWAKTVNAGDSLEMEYELEYKLDRELAGQGNENGEVDTEELLEFLERTSGPAGEIDRFLTFDNLSGVPKLNEKGVVQFDTPLDSLIVVSLLHQRVRALAWLNRNDEAWDELLRMQRLTQRFKDAWCLIEFMFNASYQEQFAETLELLAMRSCPPDELTSRFPLPEATLDKAHVFEGEVAWLCQTLTLGNDSSDGGEWGYDDEAWFAWLRPDEGGSDFWDWEERSAAELYRFAASMLHQKFELYNAAREGREPRGLDVEGKMLWQRALESDARQNIYGQRANLVVALRVFEAEGNPLSDFAFDAEKYPDLTLRHTEDGAEIQFADTERVGLASDMVDPDFEPATLPPLNGG